MKALVAILFAMMLAATYAGGPVAACDSEALSSCCSTCSCDVEPAPAGALPPVSAAPAGLLNAVKELALAPRLVVVRILPFNGHDSDFRFTSVAEAPASAGAVPLFARDCALLI